MILRTGWPMASAVGDAPWFCRFVAVPERVAHSSHSEGCGTDFGRLFDPPHCVTYRTVVACLAVRTSAAPLGLEPMGYLSPRAGARGWRPSPLWGGRFLTGAVRMTCKIRCVAAPDDIDKAVVLIENVYRPRKWQDDSRVADVDIRYATETAQSGRIEEGLLPG